MKHHVWSALILCGVAGVVMAGSTAPIVISKPQSQKINIAVEPFGGDASAAQIAAVLASDLVRSDWFNYVAAGNAEVVVRGTVSGGQLNGAVYSRGGTTPVLQKVCAGDGANPRSVAHQMADEIVRNIAGKPGIAQTRIACIANKSGSPEIYVMDYDGANVSRLTNNHTITARPRFGPNRRTLVYTSYRSGWPDVYIMPNIASPAPYCVSSYPGLNTGGAISPDGRRLAVILSKDGNPELYVKELATSSLTRLSRTRQAESSPCWSPDGSQICFVSDRAGQPQLYIMSASGGEARRMTFGGYKTEPDWAAWSVSSEVPDICFCARAGKVFQVFGLKSRTGEEMMLTQDGADNEDPCWAPDGRHIVYSRTVGHRSSLYILDAFTGRTIELNPNLSILGDCTAPAWSR
jgi:TolB protein